MVTQIRPVDADASRRPALENRRTTLPVARILDLEDSDPTLVIDADTLARLREVCREGAS